MLLLMASSSPRSILTDFAQELLLQGKDRMPYRFDGRRAQSLLRYGLLRYPDGTYSVSETVMEDAIDWWRLVARVPRPGGSS